MGQKFNPLIFTGLDFTGGGSTIGIGTPISGSTPYSILSVDGSSTLSERGPLTDGQLLIGKTGFPAQAATLTGTTNQLTVSSNPGQIILALPQDIHTSANPTFSTLNLSAVGAQINLSSGINQLTINSGTSVAARSYGVPDVGVSGFFVMTEGNQTLNGDKTFTNEVLAPGLDSATGGGTIGLGFVNASIINIGHSGATVNIQGTTNTIDVTNLNVTDKNITINDGGSAGSASGAGIEVEEAAVITGYAVVNAGRTSWSLKAPATAGIVDITPGASGFTIDQGSHNPLTLTTVGLGISLNSGTQELSAQTASGSQPGLLSSTDWTTFNDKANATLNNLGTTAINASLIPASAGTIALGTSASYFSNGYINLLKDSSDVASLNLFTRILSNSSGTTVLNYSGTDLDINTRKITNVTDPSSAQDAATKNYVDTADSNKANITLNNLGTTAVNANLFFAISGSVKSQNLSGASATNNMTFATGDASGTAATGQISVISGSNTNASNTSATGLAVIRSGNSNGSGTTGQTIAKSGNNTGTGNSGILSLLSGDTVSGNTGSVTVLSGTSSSGGTTGQAFIGTGATSAATGNTLVKTGDSSASTSGDITIQTGTAATTRGQIVLNARQISANSTNIVNVLDPVNAQDAATKNYVQTQVAQAFTTGDIALTSFSAANNQVAAADVTGLAFNTASVRSFEAILSVTIDATADLYEQFKLSGIYNDTSWYFNVTSIGDSSGIVFTITNAGQVQYTSGNEAGFVSSTMKFRAQVTTV